MSSIPSRTRQNSPSHFMTVANLDGQVYAYNPNAAAATFTNATWASSCGAGVFLTGAKYLSSISQAGGLLKDLGKNVVSSGRYFRKIQLVVPNVPGTGASTNGVSTFGVAGTDLGTYPNQDFLTGYIELGYEGGGKPAPVVQFGTL